MKALTAFYDPHCGLCSGVKAWLGSVSCFVPLHFVAYDSVLAADLFPHIEDFHPESEILVLADDGAFYRGGDAWIMCLWATVPYRSWALRLAAPALRPLAAGICHAVSRNRHTLSRFLRCRDEDEVRAVLGQNPPADECRLGGLRMGES